MSQSTVNLDPQIKVRLTLDDAGEPQAIAVSGTGNIPRSAVRAIAEEALESYYGLVNHGYRVQLSPEVETDEDRVFEIYRSVTFTRK